MNPFVRGGGGLGGPAAAHAQRGARQWAKQWSNSPLPELPPSALAGDRATRRQAEKGPVQACGPELPPSRPKTGGVQATSRRRTLNQAAAKASNGTVMHARTPTPGRSRDVRATRRRARLSKSSTIEGGREMRLMGVMTGHVNCLPLWHPKVQAIKIIIIWWLLEQWGRMGLLTEPCK